MKSRINLYLEEFRPVKEPLPLPVIGASWFLAVIVVLVFTNMATEAVVDTKQAGRRLSTTHTQLTQQITQLEADQASRQQDPKLIAALVELEDELRAKQILLAELVGREKFKNNGFSLLMDDLASRNESDLWLTQIRVEEEQVYIRGNTVKSEAVPRWVNGLRTSDYFSGKSFAGVKLFKDNSDDLSFILSTEVIKQQPTDSIIQQALGQQTLGNQAMDKQAMTEQVLKGL